MTRPVGTLPPAPKPDQKDQGPATKETSPDHVRRGADPKFQALKKDITSKKRTVGTSHPPAKTEAGAAQAASVPPADDREARGKAAHAEDMDAAQPKKFNKAEFVKAVPQPRRRGLGPADIAAGQKRYRMRVEERQEYGFKMAKLARKPKGPGRFEVIGYVVHGYDKRGPRRGLTTSRSDLEAVAEAGLGDQVPGAGGIGFELAA